MVEEVRYENLTWPDISDMPDKDRVIIAQPFAAVEQHGPHGPLDTDCNHLRTTVPDAAVQAGRRGQKVLVGSLIPYGYSISHWNSGEGPDQLPGTISLSATTYLALVQDICRSFIRAGFRRFVLLSGHNGNLPLLEIAAREIRHETGALAAVTSPFALASPALREIFGDEVVTHAGDFETSVSLAVEENTVRKDRLSQGSTPRRLPGAFLADLFPETTAAGAVGFPERSDRKKGEQALAAMTDALADFFVAFGRLPL